MEDELLTAPTVSQRKGAFAESLQRNNKKIREDRAIAITEDAQLIYKREVEDMEIQIKQIKRERDQMLDLSPTNADSLVLATDFNFSYGRESSIDSN